MKNMIIADTGFFVALSNRRDNHHQSALKCLHFLANQSAHLITTCAVITEASYLIFQRGGFDAQQKFIEQYENNLFEMFELRSEHTSRLKQLMIKYKELPMDLADASLVILAEHLGHGRILSTDQRDFSTYRWKNHQPFENLLLPNFPR
jgi:uncharacterized protein